MDGQWVQVVVASVTVGGASAGLIAQYAVNRVQTVESRQRLETLTAKMEAAEHAAAAKLDACRVEFNAKLDALRAECVTKEALELHLKNISTRIEAMIESSAGINRRLDHIIDQRPRPDGN